MCENINPKVIVDNDFLDLRSVSSRPFSKRPISTHGIIRVKGSSSNDTQGKASTGKEVLPGRQRLLKTCNKRNSDPFSNKKNDNLPNTQPVDCRFRRKIENKSRISRSETILQESEETKDEKNSNEGSNHTHSSESKKREECPVRTLIFEPQHEEENGSMTKPDNNVSPSVFPFKALKGENDLVDLEIKESSQELNVVRNEGEENFENPLNYIQPHVMKNTKKPRNNSERNGDWRNSNNHGKLQRYETKIAPPFGFYSLPTFKKSWTVPSLTLMKNEFLWTRNYNTLCTKVDRMTYEFDTDDTVSDSEDLISAYSLISRSNYMNLIFCLGCLCGIFLVGGILTASGINAEYHRTLANEDGIFEALFSQISQAFRLILNVFHQILILPSTKLFRTSVEPTKQWNVLTKYLYFLPE